MTWEPHSLPSVTPESRRYWEAAGDGELLLRKCTGCDLTFHYPRTLCPDCLDDTVKWTKAQGTGTVYSYTVTELDENSPVVLAYVELAEGPIMLANIVDCPVEDIVMGANVTVDFVPTNENIGIPVFVLSDNE